MRRITFTSSTLIGVAVVGPTFLKGAYMAKVHRGKNEKGRGGLLFHTPPPPSAACFWTDIFTDDVDGFPPPRIFASPPGANRIQA
jgi:hypothetical protein